MSVDDMDSKGCYVWVGKHAFNCSACGKGAPEKVSELLRSVALALHSPDSYYRRALNDQIEANALLARSDFDMGRLKEAEAARDRAVLESPNAKPIPWSKIVLGASVGAVVVVAGVQCAT
eukprot:m51a1_g5606 hypothetical protein (120) ;mRNA; f:705690-706674